MICHGNLNTDGMDEMLDASTPGRGRYAVARMAYSAGEVIEQHQPFASVLKQRRWSECCLACYRRPDDAVDVKKLLRCSKCHAASYCSKECQLFDWHQGHKVICSKVSLARQQLDDDDLDDAMLLLITLKNLKLSPDTACRKLKCGAQHVLAMCTGGGYFNEAMVRVISTVVDLSQESPELVATMYARFRSNNFGVMDELMNCIAVGVYPRTALLNHSCDPNCLLRYTFTSSGPVLSLVTLRHVPAGEELTHSYCDSTAPRGLRQSSLKAIHGFTCSCPLCSSTPLSLLADLQQEDLKIIQQQMKEWADQPLQVVIKTAELKREHLYAVSEALTTELLLSQSDYDSCISTVQSELLAAETQLLSHETQAGETELIRLYEGSILRMLDVVGPYHFDVYKIRCRLLSTYLLEGDIKRAFEVCKSLVGYLAIALGRFQFHPLLGLQLFTLGDLACALDKLDEAGTYFKAAKKILLPAYGPSSDMVHRLQSSMVDFD